MPSLRQVHRLRSNRQDFHHLDYLDCAVARPTAAAIRAAAAVAADELVDLSTVQAHTLHCLGTAGEPACSTTVRTPWT